MSVPTDLLSCTVRVEVGVKGREAAKESESPQMRVGVSSGSALCSLFLLPYPNPLP
jgi:hypothetical protein